MTYVARSIIAKGDPRAAYELAKDMESFPKFMPDVQSVEVVKRGENMTVTDWSTEIDGTEIIWTEEDHFDDEHLTVSYKIQSEMDNFSFRSARRKALSFLLKTQPRLSGTNRCLRE